MTPADLALDNAIHFEGVKVAYRQTKDGVVISFVVHPHDVPKGLAEAPLGSRYIVALVQVGDDEQPIQKEVMPNPQQSKQFDAQPQPSHDKPTAGAKRTASGEASSRSRMDWRELQPAAQAGIRCADPVFMKFLDETYTPTFRKFMRDPARTVRYICCIESRSELGTNHKARVLWKQLDDEFLGWKALERA